MLILRIFFLAILAPSEGKDKSMQPTYTALNLNVTFHWTPPDGIELTGNEVLLYTVHHASNHKNVASCVNITRTACCLVEMFPNGNEFGMSEIFFVRYKSSERPSVNRRSEGKMLMDYYVDISAPIIYNATITSRNVTVKVHGPETPFIKNSRRRLMGEDGLGGDLTLTGFKIYYKSSLINLDDYNEAPIKRNWGMSQCGNLSIRYRDLKPNTNYRIRIQSKLDELGDPSRDVTTMDFHTKQEAPEFAPIIIAATVLRSSCDVRDIFVSWKESSYQRTNVDITNYTVTVVGSKSNESKSEVLPGDTFSVSLPSLNRWEKYEVHVTSSNSQGNRTGDVSNITEDRHDEDSYKPTKMKISPISSRRWELVWNPPTQHQQCTVGFKVTTFVYGRQEETITVHGYNVSSATLHFQKVGRYTVDLSPIIDDSALTVVTTTTEYYVKQWNLRQWAILSSVITLLVITLVAVIIMANKVCCNLDDLPDISKSRPMRIASRNGGYVPSLKSPPEKEVFHKINPHLKPAAGTTTPTKDDHSYSDDDVFEAKPSYCDPSAPIPNYIILDQSSILISGYSPKSTFTNEGVCTVDEISQSEEHKNGTSGIGPPIHNLTSDDGYVSNRSACKINPNTPTYIPNHHYAPHKPGTLSTQSSDSGISSTTYGGSISDYVPPSPFSDSDQNNTFYGYDFGSESPYVTSSLVGRSGRLPSGSTSSEPDDEQMSYKRIDSRRLDEDPRGYLPMIPASPCKKT